MSSEILPRRVTGATIGTASCRPEEQRRFLAELKRQQRRGEIGAVWTDKSTKEESRKTGRFVVAYQRLAEPRSRMPLYATLTAGALGTLITVGVLAWHARYVILSALAVLGLVWFLATRTTHAGICPGLHCRGCRG